ncbi:MAG: hypothetical protein CFE26_18955 [Verrucomicrobiales bacterium VVV1]|nr:MAG: hypothetical protein CFE26_18955 [Verrucomicrobiales bacterium VVV1]
MSGYDPTDWKWQVCDLVEGFLAGFGPGRDDACTLMLEDEGQVNLMWDAIAPLFPTNRFRSGDGLTAIEAGRFFGHWESLWRTIIESVAVLERLTESNRTIVEIRDKIDTVLGEHMPEAIKGVETGVFHLLASATDTDFVRDARDKPEVFERLRADVLHLVHKQNSSDKEAFLSGYGESVGRSTIDENGQPRNQDKLAMLLAFTRPYAKRADFTAGEFQDAIDQLANAQITGNPERFAKHLQRRKASLRGKGRPWKKPASVPKGGRKKSDNL